MTRSALYLSIAVSLLSLTVGWGLGIVINPRINQAEARAFIIQQAQATRTLNQQHILDHEAQYAAQMVEVEAAAARRIAHAEALLVKHKIAER